VTGRATQNDRRRASVSKLQSLAPDGRTCPSPHRRPPSRSGSLGAPGPGRPPVGQVGPLSARPSGEPAAPPGRRPEAGSGAPHLPHRPGWRPPAGKGMISSQFLPSRSRHRAEPGRGPHHAPGHRRRRADPRLILAQPTGVFSQGHLSANCRTAVETRVHQSGGQPTSPAPAHGRALTRSPPLPGGQGVAAAPGKPLSSAQF
jgi:hypothetical protein